MGVSGSGKSTIGQALGEGLNCPFIEGDDLHPPENIRKMRQGVPLDDHDRIPWLRAIAAALNATGKADWAVASCSALKRGYRNVLREALDRKVRFLYLAGERKVLIERMSQREEHFMPTSLLESQLATLEAPVGEEDVLTIDFDLPPSEIVARAVEFLS
jgi:gluconokinase